MYYILSLLNGVVISVMILVNGLLNGAYSLHWATVFIHFTGLILIAFILLMKKERPFARRYPWVFYLGGAVGVLNTIFNNYAVGRISISAILALSLLGQSLSGLMIDHFGLVGMPKHRLSKGNLMGLVLIFIGIAAMLMDFEAVGMRLRGEAGSVFTNFALLPVLLSLAAGVGVILNRTFNAKLAEASTAPVSTFFNYFVGLALALPVYFLFYSLGVEEVSLFAVRFTGPWYLYAGGFIGVGMVMLSSVLSLKIAVFFLAVLLFIGQIVAGVLIDAVLDGAFSLEIFSGGVFVTAGLITNLLMDRRKKQNAAGAA